MSKWKITFGNRLKSLLLDPLRLQRSLATLNFLARSPERYRTPGSPLGHKMRGRHLAAPRKGGQLSCGSLSAQRPKSASHIHYSTRSVLCQTDFVLRKKAASMQSSASALFAFRRSTINCATSRGAVTYATGPMRTIENLDDEAARPHCSTSCSVKGICSFAML